MKHPKVPPDCPHFKPNKGGGYTFVPNHLDKKDDQEWWPLDNPRRDYADLISAVAEKYWRAEAERLDLIQEEWCESHDPEDINQMPEGGDEAVNIALEWRVWGEQK